MVVYDRTFPSERNSFARNTCRIAERLRILDMRVAGGDDEARCGCALTSCGGYLRRSIELPIRAATGLNDIAPEPAGDGFCQLCW